MNDSTEAPTTAPDSLPPVADDPPEFDHEIVDNNHHNTGDDGEMLIDPEPGHPDGEDAEHPANPALVPLQPPPKLTQFVALTEHELAEKGKALAKEYVEIESLKAKKSSLSAQIKAKEETIGALVIAITSGQMEVPVEQQDLLRQPVGAQEAARTFEAMAAEAKAASQEVPAEGGPDAAKAEAELNAMAEGIQAGQGIDAPGEAFQNDIENFKAKAAAKRKGKA